MEQASSSERRSRSEELYRRVRITAGSRFNASRRLAWHDQIYQWSVASASIALIIVPLLQVLGATTGVSPQWLSVFQIALAIFVLVFSILLGRNNHAVRADRMHRCGLELKKLLRQMENYRAVEMDDAPYEKLSKSYDEILDQHENHTPVDYERYLLYCRDEFYPGRSWSLVLPWVRAHAQLAIEFFPYLALIGIMVAAFLVMTGSSEPRSQ